MNGQATLGLDLDLPNPGRPLLGAHHLEAGDTERGAAEKIAPRTGTWRRRVLHHRYDRDHEHCGCCGDCFRWLAGAFCTRCRNASDHLGAASLAPWDRTFQAIHGEPCPWQVAA